MKKNKKNKNKRKKNLNVMKTSLNAIMETAIKNLLLKQMLNILNIYMIYSVIYDFYLKE